MQRTPKQGRKLKFSGKNGVNIRKKSGMFIAII